MTRSTARIPILEISQKLRTEETPSLVCRANDNIKTETLFFQFPNQNFGFFQKRYPSSISFLSYLIYFIATTFNPAQARTRQVERMMLAGRRAQQRTREKGTRSSTTTLLSTTHQPLYTLGNPSTETQGKSQCRHKEEIFTSGPLLQRSKKCTSGGPGESSCATYQPAPTEIPLLSQHPSAFQPKLGEREV